MILRDEQLETGEFLLFVVLATYGISFVLKSGIL